MLKDNVRFVYLDGKLQSMKRDHVVYYLDKMEADDYWRIGGSEPQLVSQVLDFYEGEDDFKAGKKMCESAFMDMKVTEILDRCNLHLKGGKAWFYDNGRAVVWDASEHIHKVIFDGVRYIAVNVEFPVLYRCAEDVYEWNNYIYKDDKGNQEEREGMYVPLIPDEDQKPLVNKLKDVIKECEEAGLKVFFDSECYNLGIVNYRRVKDFGYRNDLDVNDEQVESTIPLNFHRDCYLNCSYMDCDDVLVIRKK